jgi:hypothetical protein
MTVSSTDQLKEQIEAAFAEVPPPGDEPGGDEADINQDFGGKHWKELSREVLRRHHEALPLLTEAGRQFYLPAYLCAALNDPDLLFWVTIHLSGDREWLVQTFSRYSQAQRRAIRSFLEHVRDDPAADGHFAVQALEKYWREA